MDEHYTKNERSWRWVFYAVLPAIFSFSLAFIYDLCLKYELSQAFSRHFLEFILMIFAIAISILDSAMNVENKFTKKTKEKYSGVSVLCCFFCLVFYGFLYNETISENEIATLVLRILFFILTTFIICVGFRFQQIEENHNNNPDQKNEKIEEK